MTNEFPKQALDKFRQWHFWWLVVFSFLLIITFVYYLPTRFLQQAGMEAPHDAPMDMPVDESQPHGHEKEANPSPEAAGHMMPTEGGSASGGEDMIHGQMMTEGHGGAVYHEENQVKEGLAVNLNVSPVPYNTGVPLSLDFFVNQKPGNVPVLANQLEVEHTKLMHVVGLRSDMNEFFHIHPQFLADSPAIFSVDHVFNKPGLYKIWSSVKKDGVDHTFGHSELNITGDGPREEKKVTFSRNAITGDYQVSLVSSDTVIKGREVELSFDIHSLTGMEIEVEQYLGADMHLSIIRDDWKQFMHVHPAQSHTHAKGVSPQDLKEATLYGTSPEGYDHGNFLVAVALAHGGTEDEPAGATDEHQTGQASGGDEGISFHVTFPEAGLYKAFAQFRPKDTNLPPDEAITAEFWLQIEEKAPFPVSQWWGLLVVSALLIAGLSWWVNRYLKVKPEDIKVQNAK